MCRFIWGYRFDIAAHNQRVRYGTCFELLSLQRINLNVIFYVKRRAEKVTIHRLCIWIFSTLSWLPKNTSEYMDSCEKNTLLQVIDFPSSIFLSSRNKYHWKRIIFCKVAGTKNGIPLLNHVLASLNQQEHAISSSEDSFRSQDVSCSPKIRKRSCTCPSLWSIQITYLASGL